MTLEILKQIREMAERSTHCSAESDSSCDYLACTQHIPLLLDLVELAVIRLQNIANMGVRFEYGDSGESKSVSVEAKSMAREALSAMEKRAGER